MQLQMLLTILATDYGVGNRSSLAPFHHLILPKIEILQHRLYLTL